MRPVHRLIDSLTRSLKTRGVNGTVRHAVGRAVERLTHADAVVEEGRRRDAELDEEFDRTHGVDTGGMIPASSKDIDSENWVHASAYIPMAPIDLGAMLKDEGIRYEETIFVDLGCGKGRVVLLAAGLPFKRVIGVEFSRSLSEIAKDNVRRYRGPRACFDVDIVAGDAAEYAWPPDPLVVFMYHPFDATIMARVAANLEAANAAHPRRILVIYWKPVHAEVLDSAAFLSCTVPYHIYDTLPRTSDGR